MTFECAHLFRAGTRAGAAVFIHNQTRYGAALRALEHHRVTTLCAPPTAWRFLEDLSPMR